MENQLKDISSDTSDLRCQLNALENKQNRFCLLLHGLPEKTQTSQPSGQARYRDDVADFIDLVNQRLEVELAHRDITDAYRLPSKEKTGIRPLITAPTAMQFCGLERRLRVLVHPSN